MLVNMVFGNWKKYQNCVCKLFDLYFISHKIKYKQHISMLDNINKFINKNNYYVNIFLFLFLIIVIYICILTIKSFHNRRSVVYYKINDFINNFKNKEGMTIQELQDEINSKKIKQKEDLQQILNKYYCNVNFHEDVPLDLKEGTNSVTLDDTGLKINNVKLDYSDMDPNNNKLCLFTELGQKIKKCDDKNLLTDKCNTIESSNQHGNGEGCGYCKNSVDGKGVIMFGNNDGPIANYCKEEHWVSPTQNVKNACIKKESRDYCKSKSNCQFDGQIAIIGGNPVNCGWCPVTSENYVTDNNYKPLYSKDKETDGDFDSCEWKMPESWTDKEFGPLITSTMPVNGNTVNMCEEFGEQFPCMGNNYLTGPHSDACLESMFKENDCFKDEVTKEYKKQDIIDGVRASNFELKNDYLTNMSGTDNNFNGIPVYGNNSLDSNVKNIKKNIEQNELPDGSKDYDREKNYYKACYGVDKNPQACQSKYSNIPVDCMQEIFDSFIENHEDFKNSVLNPQKANTWNSGILKYDDAELREIYASIPQPNNINQSNYYNTLNDAYTNYIEAKNIFESSSYNKNWSDYEIYVKNYMVGTGSMPDVSNHKPCWKDITDTMMSHKGVTYSQRYGIVFDTSNMNQGDELKNVIFMRDITEEKRGNANIRYLKQELYESEQYPFWKLKSKSRSEMNKSSIWNLFTGNLNETKRLKTQMGIDADSSDNVNQATYNQQTYNYGNKIREMKKFVKYHD